MEIRRANRNDGAVWRDIRLRSLADSPDSFGQTYAQALMQPESAYHEAAAQAADPASDSAIFLAFEGPQSIGVATADVLPPPALTEQQVTILRRAVMGVWPAAGEARLLGAELSQGIAVVARRKTDAVTRVMLMGEVLWSCGINATDYGRVIIPAHMAIASGQPPTGSGDKTASRKTVSMGGLWVDPAHRRRGVGLAIVDACAAWARERGAARLADWVTESHADAVRFYERAGFTDTGLRWLLLSNPTLPIAFMAREL